MRRWIDCLKINVIKTLKHNTFHIEKYTGTL